MDIFTNPILDHLMRKESGCSEHIRVLMSIYRYSYGYQRQYCCRLDGDELVPMVPIDIARLLNLPRQSVHRSIKHWAERGLVSYADSRIYALAVPGGTVTNMMPGANGGVGTVDDEVARSFQKSDYGATGQEAHSDDNSGRNSDYDIKGRKESFEKKAASSKPHSAGLREPSAPVASRRTEAARDQVLEIQTFLTAMFVSKFGVAASYSFAANVAVALGSAPLEQFKIAVRARSADFRSYSLARVLAAECAMSKEDWSKAINQPDESEQQALDFVRRHNERKSRSKTGVFTM